jgi:hypothetical protein
MQGCPSSLISEVHFESRLYQFSHTIDQAFIGSIVQRTSSELVEICMHDV